MNHPVHNMPPLDRFQAAVRAWCSPDAYDDVAEFSKLWFGPRCALLEYAKSTDVSGNFDQNARVSLQILTSMSVDEHQTAAQAWNERLKGKPNAQIAERLAHTVQVLAHGLAAVVAWHDSRWGSREAEIETARQHLGACWRALINAFPAPAGIPTMPSDNAFHGDRKLKDLLSLLPKHAGTSLTDDLGPFTVMHWLMLQRLFDALLQRAPDYQPVTAVCEHEVRSHVVGVKLHGETRRLTVSRVPEGPPGWYLDLLTLGATGVDPVVLKQLQLAWRVATTERRIEQKLPSDAPMPPLRIAIHSDELAALAGPSAGGILLLSLHAAMSDGLLREDTTASFDIQTTRAFGDAEPIRLSDIDAFPVEPDSVWRKVDSLIKIPPTNRLLLAHSQACFDSGQNLDWDTWAQEARQKLRVECVPVRSALNAWQQFSGGEQLRAATRYCESLIEQADVVPVYLRITSETKLPQVRVQVRVRTKINRDDFQARVNEFNRLDGVEPHQAYIHRLSDEFHHDQSNIQDVVLDWDSQVRPKLKRGVVLGDPGMGKSWLLKHEARRLATTASEHLRTTGMIHSLVWPVLIPLSALAGVLAKRAADESRDLLSVVQAVLRGDRVEEFVIKQITTAWGSDRCVLLLDAWDEVRPEQQGVLRKCLEDWARDPQFAAGPILITSRLVTRPDPFWPMLEASESERELELQPFGDTQTREFIQRLFHFAPAVAQALITALPSAPQLRGLSQIPLLLSFLCRYAHNEVMKRRTVDGTFPSLDLRSLRRLDLYEDIVTQFLKRTWHDDRDGVIATKLQQRQKVVAHVAFHLLRTGHQQFPYDVFEDRLGNALSASVRGRSLTDAGYNELLEALVGRDALVIPVSAGDNPSYLFLHLTIQEYFAACYLQALPLSELGPLIGRLWDHPAWLEVWNLLASGCAKDRDQGPQRLEFMIATIHQECHQHRLDANLHRHRLASLRWIIIARVEPNERTPIALECTQWAVRILTQRSPEYLYNELLSAVSRTHGRLPNPLEQSLLARLNEGVTTGSIEESTELTLDLPEIKESTDFSADLTDVKAIDPITDDRDTCEIVLDDRCIIAKIVGQHAVQQPFREALIKGLDDESESVRSVVAGALAPYATEPDVMDALLRHLGDRDQLVRGAIVAALRPHANDTRVRDALLMRIDDTDESVCLATLASLAPQVVETYIYEALLNRADHWSRSVRESIALALTHSAADSRIRDALLNRLDDGNERVRAIVAKALAPRATEPRVREALLRQFDDADEQVRSIVAEALGPHTTESRVREAFLGRLEDESDLVRDFSTQALALYATEPLILEALLKRFGDKSHAVCRSATLAIALHAAEPRVSEALHQRLDDESEWVRVHAAEALGSQIAEPRVRAALLKQLDDQHEWVRRSIVVALGTQVTEPVVRESLLDRLHDKSVWVREVVVAVLGPYVAEPLVRESFLLRLRNGDHWSVIRIIVSALRAQMFRRDVREALLNWFRDGRDRTTARMVVEVLEPYSAESVVRESLLDRLRDVDDFLLFEAVVAALSPQIAVLQVHAALVAQLNEKQKSWQCRCAVINSLQPHAAELRTQTVLLKQLEDRNSNVRGAATTALRRHAMEPRVQEALIGLLTDQSEMVRIQVVAAFKAVAIWERHLPMDAGECNRPSLGLSEL